MGPIFLGDQKSGALMRLGTISVIARLSSGNRVKMAELGAMKIQVLGSNAGKWTHKMTISLHRVMEMIFMHEYSVPRQFDMD